MSISLNNFFWHLDIFRALNSICGLFAEPSWNVSAQNYKSKPGLMSHLKARRFLRSAIKNKAIAIPSGWSLLWHSFSTVCCFQRCSYSSTPSSAKIQAMFSTRWPGETVTSSAWVKMGVEGLTQASIQGQGEWFGLLGDPSKSCADPSPIPFKWLVLLYIRFIGNDASSKYIRQGCPRIPPSLMVSYRSQYSKWCEKVKVNLSFIVHAIVVCANCLCLSVYLVKLSFYKPLPL